MFDGAGTGSGEKTLEDKFFEHEVRWYTQIIQTLGNNTQPGIFYLIKLHVSSAGIQKSETECTSPVRIDVKIENQCTLLWV